MNIDPVPSPLPNRPSCALALMAKVPFAGAVKTRLTPPLTSEEAATLSMCFLRDMTTSVASLSGGRTKGVLMYTPAGAETSLYGLLPNGFKLLAQRGETLGDRLASAAAELLNEGFRSVCLINSDSPTLPGEILITAASLLAQEGDRVVLGPSQDGGYYLIGLKNVHSRLFDRIAWSTAEVLAHTVERAAEIGLEVEMLPLWYDVDDGATLNQLCEELFLSRRQDGNYPAPHTRQYLATLIESQRIFPELAGRTRI